MSNVNLCPLSTIQRLMVVLTIGILTGSASFDTAQAQQQAKNTSSVAHRGDKQHYPDNSLAGINSAAEKGADWIEIDLQYNHDGDTFSFLTIARAADLVEVR